MRLSIIANHHRAAQPSTWWSRVGLAGFLFFLLKGILWVLAPVLFVLGQ
ncbi:MAG: hypothetical protein QM771_16430 [Nitrospira sp.]|jgi:hypothetical protein